MSSKNCIHKIISIMELFQFLCTCDNDATGPERGDCDLLTIADAIAATSPFTRCRTHTNTGGCGGGAATIPEEFGVYTLINSRFKGTPESIGFN
jgi:hypothetical protein